MIVCKYFLVNDFFLYFFTYSILILNDKNGKYLEKAEERKEKRFRGNGTQHLMGLEGLEAGPNVW